MQQHSNRKGVSTLISTVLYIALAAGAVVGIYLFAAPLAENLADTSIVSNMMDGMNDIEDTLVSVAELGQGSQQTLSLGFRKGQLQFERESDTVEFTLDTAAGIISPGDSQRFGNLRISSGANVDINRTSVNGVDCWQMENDHIETCIRDVPEIHPELLAYYSLDRGSGQEIEDESTYNNTGTRGQGQTTEPSDPAWETDCIYSNCLRFDGSDDLVNTTWNSSLGLHDSFTVGFFLNYDGTATSPYLSKGDGATANTFLTYVDSSGTWHFENENGAVTADGQIDTDRWQYLTAAQNSTHVTFYIDGVKDSTKALASAPATTNALKIGTDGQGSYGQGRIDEVAVYNKTLPADEIEDRYGTGDFHDNYLKTKELMLLYKNKDTGFKVQNPEIQSYINNDDAAGEGFGHTEVSAEGVGLPEGTVTATLKTSAGISYDLDLTLMSGSDFLLTEVTPN